jgi:hypothetical protein
MAVHAALQEITTLSAGFWYADYHRRIIAFRPEASALRTQCPARVDSAVVRFLKQSWNQALRAL